MPEITSLVENLVEGQHPEVEVAEVTEPDGGRET